MPDGLTHTPSRAWSALCLARQLLQEQRLLGRLISNEGGQAAPVPTLQVAKLNTKHGLTSRYRDKLGFISGPVLDPGQGGH